MQGSFCQPVLSIEIKISDLGAQFLRKVKKCQKQYKNRKFDFSEGHNFLFKKLGVAAYPGELSQPVQLWEGNIRENKKIQNFGSKIPHTLFRRL